MTTYGALHPKSDVYRLYMQRKEGGRGLIGVERCVREKENSLRFYVTNSGENLIRGVAAAGTLRTEGIVTNGGLKIWKEQERKQNWDEKKMKGQFVKEMPEKVDKKRAWQWLSRFKDRNRSIVVCCKRTGH